MKINYKGISICGVLALLAASMATSCTDGFEKINDYPFSDSIPVIGGGDSNFNIDDISMPSPDSISDEERAALEANLSTIGQEFKTFTYEGLVNDYQRTTNLTHDIYAGYFANNKLDFIVSSPNYVYTEDWSGRRWSHFYQDRSKEYRTLANTFWYVDHEAHRNAFYMTRIWYAFLASTMADTYGDMPFGVYVQGLEPPTQCPYNTQEQVYDMVFRMLSEAADSIQPGACSFTFADREDKVFNGDEAKWVRFANSLRLRLALRIVNVDPERAYDEAVAAINHPAGLMQSQDDNVETVPNYAPIDQGGEDASGEENEVANCGFRYADVVMSLDMEQAYNNLIDKDAAMANFGDTIDPRCTICWYRPTPKNFLEAGREMPNKQYHGNAIGNNEFQTNATDVYSPLKVDHNNGKVLSDTHWFSYSRPYIWFGYAELKFLLAEATLRGWTYSYGSAEDLFREGIRESFNYYHMADKADAYISSLKIYNGEDNPFAGGDNEAQLEQIITQKWLAIFPNGNEGWAEFRRTDYPRLNNHLNNRDANIPAGKFIKRIDYPGSETDYNAANMPQGVNQGTRVWWDVQDTNGDNGERNTPDNFRSLY